VNAYILIEANLGKSREIVKQVQKLEGVKSASAVTGPYDVILYVEVPDSTVLGDLIFSKIQKIDGVAGTLTNVVVD
jgi:DNA-binding Lrp family transcriptional regulator